MNRYDEDPRQTVRDIMARYTISTERTRAALDFAGLAATAPPPFDPSPAGLAADVLGQYFTAEDIERGITEGGSIEVTVYDPKAARCVLCEQDPCSCPPFGSDAYMAMTDKRHRDSR